MEGRWLVDGMRGAVVVIISAYGGEGRAFRAG